MRVRRSVVVGAVLLFAFGLGVDAPAAVAGSRTPLVVDDDRAQCPGAGYTAIQPAIDAADAGDTVRVCGGTYPGDLYINNAVSLIAHAPAAPSVDCVAGAAAGAASTIIGAVVLTGTGATVDGFVVTGASTGITSSDQGSGYQIRRNVIEGNHDYGIELQSGGQRRTVVENNCVRGNGTEVPRAGIASENGALRNAVIRGNTTARNFESISVDGAFPHTDISISGNTIRQESYGLVVSGTVGSDLTGNDIDFTGFASRATGIVVGEANVGLTVASNTVAGAFPGLFFQHRDGSPPSVAVYVATNTFRNNAGTAISSLGSGNVGRSLLYRNVLTGNVGSGIFLGVGDDGNALIGNQSTNNARGINLGGATSTLVVGNTMSGNTLVDARDAASVQNIWIANRCNNADPATLCSAPAAASAATAQGAQTASTAPPVVSARPKVGQSRWPCLQVPVWDVDPVDGGTWVWITVVAPDAPAGTYCGT